MNTERFLSYLTFYPPKKVALPLIRVEKKFLQNSPKGYKKKQNFALISKIYRNLELNKREKIFTEKLIFQIERAQSIIVTSSVLLIQLFEFGKFGTEQKISWHCPFKSCPLYKELVQLSYIPN
jgi:hypothetical protein